MTNEELQRIGEYSDKINGADGSLSVLTFNQSVHLKMLLEKRLYESAEGSQRKHPKKERRV